MKKIEDMCNRLDTILACDRQTDAQTDGQTSCHGIVRAMHTRRAVKIDGCNAFNLLCIVHLTGVECERLNPLPEAT